MAHYIIGNTVTIGGKTFRRTNSVSIEKSATGLKDMGFVQLPLAKGLVDKKKPLATVADWLKEGQFISISMRYEKLKTVWEYTEFQGFVKRIHPTIPAKIEFQDYTYLLERTDINETFNAGSSIKAVMQRLLDLTNAKFKTKLKPSLEIQDIPVEEAFRASNTNCLVVLDKIRSNYGLQAIFINGDLYVGLAYTALKFSKTVVINLRKNVIDNNLVYSTDDNQKLQITAIGFDEKGKQQKVVVPDVTDKEFDRKITLTNVKKMSKVALTNWAKAQLTKKRFDGFTGNITTFLIPQINPGDTIVIQNPDYPFQNGKYLAEATELVKGPGIRRKTTLGNKL